jgi:integrase
MLSVIALVVNPLLLQASRPLKWKDIHLEKATAVVRGALGTVTKNNDIREVPLLPAAIQLLKELKPEES